jgi:hypothetical protein
MCNPLRSSGRCNSCGDAGKEEILVRGVHRSLLPPLSPEIKSEFDSRSPNCGGFCTVGENDGRGLRGAESLLA